MGIGIIIIEQTVGIKKFELYFFYANGTSFGGIGADDNSITRIENDAKNGNLYLYSKDEKYLWGVFNVDGSKIAFERWYPGEGPMPAYIRAGTILNDTTFVITEVYRMKDGIKTEQSKENFTYHFKAFSPKPDSTNSFVK